MRALNLGQFKRTRARFQRLSDAKSFRGWVELLNNSQAILTMIEGEPPEVGDEFFVEVFGTAAVASFNSRLALFEESHLVLELHGPIRFTSPNEDARFRSSGLRVTIRLNDKCFGGDVLDVSKNGLGIRLGAPLAARDEVVVHVDSPMGPIEGVGTIRYCRAMPDEAQGFRVGVCWKDLGRVDDGKWTRLLTGLAA